MKTIDAEAEAAARKAESPKGKKLNLTVNAPIEVADEAEPGSHLKRIFVVLLLVHVFLVGGIILYNFLKQQPRQQVAASSITDKKPAPTRTLNTAAAQKPARSTTPVAMQTEEYVIKVGDTLKGIAETSNVDEAELCAINGISPSAALEPGNVLHFPKKPASAPAKKPETEVVDKAITPKPEATAAASRPDSAAQAKLVKHEVSPDAPPGPARTVIMDAPPAPGAQDKPPGPKAGSEQIAGAATPKPQDKKPADKPKEEPKPKVAKEEPAKPKVTKEEPPKAEKTDKTDSKTRSYTVSPKDTFYSISKKFGVNVNELMKINNVKDPSKLKDGTKLKIPAKPAAP